MSTGAIIAIAILALLIVLGVVFVLPRLGARSRSRRSPDFEPRRRETVGGLRVDPDDRAQRTEQRVQIAEGEAIREHVEAQLRNEPAPLVDDRQHVTHAYPVAGHDVLDEREPLAAPVAGPGLVNERERFDGGHPASGRHLVEPVRGGWDLEETRDGHAIALELQAIAARSRATRRNAAAPVAAGDPRGVQAPAAVDRRRRLRTGRSTRRGGLVH